jgi:glutathione synthase/RimK-type ligase-like ATP-grasp enzyme
VEHRIFHSPQMAAYVPISGNWDQMLTYFESCQRDVVCKANEGTGGRDVTRARTPLELEAAVLQLFSKSRSLCLSPYIEIAAEYRVALLDGQVQFMYRKHRPSLIGDGRSSLRQLLLARMGASMDFRPQLKGLAALEEMQLDFEWVPAAAEEVPLNWRHNLGQGAVAEQLDPTEPAWQPIRDIAVRAARALGVSLASVDIVESDEGVRVLEINCGIMMESLARSGEQGRALARDLYDRIVCKAMGLEPT